MDELVIPDLISSNRDLKKKKKSNKGRWRQKDQESRPTFNT